MHALSNLAVFRHSSGMSVRSWRPHISDAVISTMPAVAQGMLQTVSITLSKNANIFLLQMC